MPRRAENQARGIRPPVERMRFRRAPLAAAAVAFGLGIVAARYSPQQAVVLVAALGLLLLLAVAGLIWALRVAFAPVLGVWVVLGMMAGAWRVAPPVSAGLLNMADGLSREVHGRVVRVRTPPPGVLGDVDAVPAWEAVEDTSGERGRPVVIDLAVEEAEEVTPDVARMVPVRGGVEVAVFQPGEALDGVRCGDDLTMPLRMRPPQRYRDPGVFQYDELLAARGVGVEASVTGPKVVRLGAGPATWTCRLAAAQAWASGRLAGFVGSAENRRLPSALRLNEADARMLSAMLFGDRSGLSHGLRVGFERTGSFHLFVVSGLHVALLAAGVFWAMRKLRAPSWLATVATLGAAAGYAAVTGFGQPAQRALAMTAVFLGARLLARDRDTLNALGAATLAMLAWAPASVFDASFQMTVLAIVSIGGIAVPLGQRSFLRYARVTRYVFQRRPAQLSPREAQLKVMLELWGETLAGLLGKWARWAPAWGVRGVLWLGELALIGLVAELVMVLPMALFFHRVAVFALPANLLVIPLIGVLLPMAILTFVCSLGSAWLPLLPGAATAGLLHLVAFGIGHVSRLAGANVRVPGPVWWVAALAVAGWAGCCWAVRRARWGAWATAAALPLIAALVLWPEPMTRVAGRLEVTSLDVGQGDSELIVGPEGAAMLVDAGGPVGRGGNAEPVSNFDVGEEVVSPYLWVRRVRRLDVVVLTHAHTDHMGGMPAVLDNFRPRELWVGVDPGSSVLYKALLAKAAALGIMVRHVRAGDHLSWGGVEVQVLAPAMDYANAGAPKNDDSVVLQMQYGQASALLEGDAERPSEDAMVAGRRLGAVTLLKAGHHGSKTSSNPAFVDLVRPRAAVISVGARNTFGHPRREVIERFAAEGTRVYRTDWFGLTTFLLGSDGSLETDRSGVRASVPALPRVAPTVPQ